LVGNSARGLAAGKRHIYSAVSLKQSDGNGVHLQRFRAKWIPVRVTKTRQNKKSWSYNAIKVADLVH
jgi:hypothetical protein